MTKPRAKLSRSMTLTQFENGYWYALDLKAFAEQLGIANAGKLRKDELERAIKQFLRTGDIVAPTARSLSKRGPKDVDVKGGLRVDQRIVNYTSDRTTKDFIVREAKRRVPGLRERSGVRYRMNRWREEQLTKGVPITYGDLVDEYIRLNQVEGNFQKIPHGRYINFLSEFLAHQPRATHAQARAAWNKLKQLDAPKTYAGWIGAQQRDDARRSVASPRR